MNSFHVPDFDRTVVLRTTIPRVGPADPDFGQMPSSATLMCELTSVTCQRTKRADNRISWVDSCWSRASTEECCGAGQTPPWSTLSTIFNILRRDAVGTYVRATLGVKPVVVREPFVSVDVHAVHVDIVRVVHAKCPVGRIVQLQVAHLPSTSMACRGSGNVTCTWACEKKPPDQCEHTPRTHAAGARRTDMERIATTYHHVATLRD